MSYKQRNIFCRVEAMRSLVYHFRLIAPALALLLLAIVGVLLINPIRLSKCATAVTGVSGSTIQGDRNSRFTGHPEQLQKSKQGPTDSADLQALSRLNQMLLSPKLDTKGCDPQEFGSGWGKHTLCGKQAPSKPCHFYSFGINKDYSFDVDVATKWGCTGFAADPTIVHNSTLHTGVTFHNIAANSPWLAKQNNSRWLSTSVPALLMWLKHERIAVLKMDCEGCEYSIAADVLADDPTFFSRVDQFTVEVHWSRAWLGSSTELHAIARLLELLEEAGLQLMSADITACGPFLTRTGLLPELQEHMSVLVSPRPNLHCHNYLFARSARKEV